LAFFSFGVSVMLMVVGAVEVWAKAEETKSSASNVTAVKRTDKEKKACLSPEVCMGEGSGKGLVGAALTCFSA
jgi:hypothetical protein